MGLGIALSTQRYLSAASVCDIDPARVQLAQQRGLSIRSSPAAIAASCSIVFIVVVNAEQIDAVLAGNDGLLAALGRQHTVLICSTIAPQDMAGFAARIVATGARFIDAPISGGPARAEQGTMSMMLAGDAATIAQHQALLAAISARRFVIGTTPGEATKAKLVNNLLAGVHLAAAAEAFALAERLGLDRDMMLELIGASSGQSWMLQDRTPRAFSDDLAPRAAAHVITKDLTLANAAAASVGMQLSFGELARARMQATCDSGLRDLDDAAVFRFTRQR
jgi:L-threonate 2-dehydrogenase